MYFFKKVAKGRLECIYGQEIVSEHPKVAVLSVRGSG